MIKHVVLMKFKSGIEEEAFSMLEKGLASLPAAIPVIREYQFGLDVVRSDRSYDFGLVSAFDDLPSLEAYQAHPEHQKVLALIREICEDIRAVDFSC
jgi:hypothetical protein